MALTLYAHPFSAYCQKALVALYENATPFTFRPVNLGDEADAAALATLWPFRKFPVLVDGTATVESKGREIFEMLLRIASGERTRSEALGYGDNEFVPWQVGATM